VILVRELDDLPAVLRGGAVSIGNFDGVHIGHARIIEQLKKQANAVGGRAIVFTFDPHPVRLLRPEAAPPPLTWTERKAQLLEHLGVDAMIAYRTDTALLALEPAEFFSRIIQDRLGARALVEGPNFYFGKNRAGNVKTLEQLCSAAQLRLEIVAPEQFEGQIVSSSRVRQLIRDGEVRRARRILTQPFRIRGMVTHGARRGAALGFPTANLEAIDTILPMHGVYAGNAYVNGSRHAAAINIGPNPTFGEVHSKVEAHILDFRATLYGEPLEIDFLDRLRDIRTFASVDELRMQLALDIQTTAAVCSEHADKSRLNLPTKDN